MGAYSPKFFLLEKRPTAQNFYGQQNFMSENQRQNKKKELESKKRELHQNNLTIEEQAQQTSMMSDAEVKKIMARRR